MLNLRLDRITSNKGLLSYGGDFITAMQAKSTAKRVGILLTVYDLLSDKSIQTICRSMLKSVALTNPATRHDMLLRMP